MATTPLPPDFSEFLRLLNENEVRYLLVGGYAVGYHGYVRATADMDVWVARDHENAPRLVDTLQEFGFGVEGLSPELFLEEERVIRMGVPPVRIEILTSISGVDFDECYEERIVEQWDDVQVNVISLPKLKSNKRASGRLKDLVDLDYLE
ncbi:MAG: hypothetical protein WA982_06665 [Rubrobacteraceae bacterium]